MANTTVIIPTKDDVQPEGGGGNGVEGDSGLSVEGWSGLE